MTEKQQPPKKNLLLVSTELRPGGAEKCLTKLAIGLDPNQFNVQVASIRSRPKPAESRVVQELESHQIPVHFLNCGTLRTVFSAIKQIRQLVQEHQIEIVQSFLFHANTVCGLALKKMQNHAPRFFANIRVADPSRIRHFFERHAIRKAEKIICVSQSVANFAVTQMKLPPERVVAIPNGVDIDDELPTEDCSSENHTTGQNNRVFALFVGRLHPQKGLVEFLNQVIQFDREQSDPPKFDLVFVGDGPLRQQLETLGKQLKNRRVEWIGQVESARKWIDRSRLTILPSKWEGMPNVLLETMARGKPFVSFGVDGVLDLFAKGADGGVGENEELSAPQIVPPGDFTSFFEKMSQFVEHQALAKKVGQGNLDRVKEHFSYEKMIANYMNAYLN